MGNQNHYRSEFQNNGKRQVRSSGARSQTAFVGVLIANLASAAMIWWYGWQAHAFLIVYWLETGVVIALYVAKINRAKGTDDPADIQSWTEFDGKPAQSYIGRLYQAKGRSSL